MGISALPVRGTRDYLPKEVLLRDYIQGIILDTYRKFGFQRINTPIMEDIERLNKSDGGENLSMIFKILKRGQKLDLTKTRSFGLNVRKKGGCASFFNVILTLSAMPPAMRKPS